MTAGSGVPGKKDDRQLRETFATEAEGEVRTGSAYEAARLAARARLAAAAEQRRVALGEDLVLVFETREMVRTALEESLRAERVAGAEEIAAEAAAFAELLGGDHVLAATLYVDVADPVALGDRLGELPGIEDSVFLEVGGRRLSSQADPGDGGSGAFHLFFAPDEDQRDALARGAAVTVGVEHPSCRVTARVDPDRVRAIAADLRR